ncbi:MAG: CHC2 zinc finger domain-containing protein, partial [Chloroflexota bacterium]
MPSSELRNEVLRRLNVLEWWQSQGVRLAKGQQGKASVKVHCPIHNDKNPSATINRQTGSLHCFTCGKNWSPFDFLMERRSWDFKQALAELARVTGVDLPEKTRGSRPQRTKTSDSYVTDCHRILLEAAPDRLDWLWSERHLDADTVRRFRIGWDPQAERFTIPLWGPKGEPLGVHLYHREAHPKFLWTKGSKAGFWGAHLLQEKQDGSVIVAEGELDAALLCQKGYIAVSGTAGATTFKPEWAALLKDREVFLCYDIDEAGRQGARKAAEALTAAKAKRVAIVHLPEALGDKGDVTDFFVKGGT